ncbi:MAG: hypothetical protein QOF88_5802, partial [Mycobacterium sp.]|nr:hypothetical protein [Mycobacterium sp.]
QKSVTTGGKPAGRLSRHDPPDVEPSLAAGPAGALNSAPPRPDIGHQRAEKIEIGPGARVGESLLEVLRGDQQVHYDG